MGERHGFTQVLKASVGEKHMFTLVLEATRVKSIADANVESERG